MVDYEDLEDVGSSSDSFRRQLIDRKTGSQSIHSTLLTPDNAYLINQRRTWHYRSISKTSYTYFSTIFDEYSMNNCCFSHYRLAISIQDGANIIVPNLELQGKVTWNNQTITRAAPWKFCDDLRANYSSKI